MTVLIANDAVQTFLGQVREKTEIRGTNGQVLGFFEPRVETEEELYERVKKMIDPDELARIKAKGKNGSTFDQMMERIQSLGDRS